MAAISKNMAWLALLVLCIAGAASQAASREDAAAAAEEELHRAEDLVGYALDEEAVDVPAGLDMLHAMFARMDAELDEMLGEAVTSRRLYTPTPPRVPPPPPPPVVEEVSPEQQQQNPEQPTAELVPEGSDAVPAAPSGDVNATAPVGEVGAAAVQQEQQQQPAAIAVPDEGSDAGSAALAGDSGAAAPVGEVGAAATAAAVVAEPLAQQQQVAGGAVDSKLEGDHNEALESAASSSGGDTSDTGAAEPQPQQSQQPQQPDDGSAAAAAALEGGTAAVATAPAEAAAPPAPVPAPAPAPAPPVSLPAGEASLNLTAHPHLAPLADAAFTLAALVAAGLAPAAPPHHASHPASSSSSPPAAATGLYLGAAERRAAYILHRAALAGSLEARIALADRYLSGRGLPGALPEVGLQHAKAAAAEVLALLDQSGAVQSDGGGALRRKWMDAGYLPAGGEWADANTLHYEQDLAARGDVEAHRQLGFRHLMGQGVPRDPAAALREFQQAARGGDAYAMFNLGFMHVRGLGGVPQNYTAAREHFLAAAAKQLPTALNGLGVLHFHGQGMPVDYAEAKRYFQMAALQDHDAAYNLATIYQGSYGVDRNMTLALELLHNATRLGSFRAPLQLMQIHSVGLFGAPCNLTAATLGWRAFMKFHNAWKDGGSDAADCAAEGDHWGAAVRYASLAEQGCPQSTLNLAWLLHRGLAAVPPPASVPASTGDKGSRRRSTGSSGGSGSSSSSDGEGGEGGGGEEAANQHVLALRLWLRAADRNYTEGMLLAAHAYLRGDALGLPGGTNVTAAVGLYRRAAALGSIEGLFTLGRLTEQGLGGLERNISAALGLYRRAVATAPEDAFAVPPWLALQWLRVRLLLAPLLRWAAAGAPARGAAAAAGGGGAGGGTQQQWQRRSPRNPPQWDTLLITVMLGALTFVLWRKRQLAQQQQQHQRGGGGGGIAAVAPAEPAVNL